MLSFFTSLLPTTFLSEWLTLDANPVDCLLQGEFLASLLSVVSHCSWLFLEYVYVAEVCYCL